MDEVEELGHLKDEMRQVYRDNPTFKDILLQKKFGFDKIEDGSAERFIKDLATVPWVKHRFWWLVHNAIAHPLIAFIPTYTTFNFHDYTSRKMHGK